MPQPAVPKIVRIATILVIFIDGSLTMIQGLRSTTQSTLGSVLPWIAGVQAISAVLLLFHRTVVPAGVMLLLIFAFLLVVHGPAQQLGSFVYAAILLSLMMGSRWPKDH